MVILYIEGKVGDLTVYLERPIESRGFITLRRCVFFNRWRNLSREGAIYDGAGQEPILRIPPGDYTAETIKRQIDGSLCLGEKVIMIEKSSLKTNRGVTLNKSLADLLDLKNKKLNAKTQHEIRMRSLGAIFIHCDLVNAYGVLKQGAPSQILACIELDKGKINFSPHSLIQLSTTSVDYVSSLRFSVKDSDGNTIENGLYPMHLILEIN